VTDMKNIFKIDCFYFISYFLWVGSRLLQLTEIRTQLQHTFAILIKLLIGTGDFLYLTFSFSE